MTEYTIEYDLTELKKLAERFTKGMTTAALPNTDAAFQRAAQMVRKTWTGFLDGSVTLPGVESPEKVTAAMIKSIKSDDKTNEKEFHHTIYSDNRQLEQLNKGSKEVKYDMKKTHPYGRKSRVNKITKIPYLIIPFRWGTPVGKKKFTDEEIKRAHFNNVIPQGNYEHYVKGMEVSKVNALKAYYEANVKGENIKRQGYDWARNGRVTEDWAWSERSIGMVKMKDMGKSVYFTFRVISADSKPPSSWWYLKPAKQGNNYFAALETAVKPKVEKIVEEGIKADEEFYRNNL